MRAFRMQHPRLSPQYLLQLKRERAGASRHVVIERERSISTGTAASPSSKVWASYDAGFFWKTTADTLERNCRIQSAAAHNDIYLRSASPLSASLAASGQPQVSNLR